MSNSGNNLFCCQFFTVAITLLTTDYFTDDISHYRAPDIALEDGQQTTVHLSSLANSYCFVEQPFSEGSLVAGQCEVGLPRATRAVQGTWNVFLGIPGRVQEVHVERQVNVRCEYDINRYKSAIYNVD